MNSIMEGREKRTITTFQCHAVIELIEKQERNKRFIKSWRSFFLVNAGYKVIAKALETKLKKNSTQTDVFSTRSICEKQVHW